ncbi:UNVERIFIED_CONTAM: hypothetical protein K2H54_001814 [Gekko kuhli]
MSTAEEDLIPMMFGETPVTTRTTIPVYFGRSLSWRETEFPEYFLDTRLGILEPGYDRIMQTIKTTLTAIPQIVANAIQRANLQHPEGANLLHRGGHLLGEGNWGNPGRQFHHQLHHLGGSWVNRQGLQWDP